MPYDKLILIGYRATGKSTVGKLIARRLSLQFLDMDQVIEERAGRSIQEIVATDGWPAFRQQEKELLTELAARQNLVVATGGGAVLHQESWARLKETGLVVWLTADRETIRARLRQDQKTPGQRPALTGTDSFSEISKVLTEREPLYRQSSHLAIDTAQASVAQIAAHLENIMKNGR